MSIFKNRSNVISYTVNKEIGSNCYVSVDGGEVVVNAPWYFSRKQIQTVIEEKKQWILNKIEEYQQQNMVYSDKGNIIVKIQYGIKLYLDSFFRDSIRLCYHRTCHGRCHHLPKDSRLYLRFFKECL